MPSTSLKAEEITDRDLDIFEDCYIHNLLSTDQIGAKYCRSKFHQGNIEKRLRKLVRAGFLVELETSRDQPNNFKLAQKGMNDLVEKRDYPEKRISSPRSSRLFRDHDLALSDFTISLSFSVRDLNEPATLIDELSIFSRSPSPGYRSNHGWKISILSHPQYGSKHDLWVKPDRLLGFRFAKRPDGRNERNFVVEVDRGTMQQTNTFDRPSILRKLLAYEHTIVAGVLSDQFRIQHPYPLFIAPTHKRRANMIDLAINNVVDEKAARSMLFAVQPAAPSFDRYTPMTEMEWINGLGDPTAFPM